ncbi:MAG: hypothetical protein WC375_13250 [Methanomassiliicoccales archaeon]
MMIGKSFYMLHRFADWYKEGNRKPDNIDVIWCDIEGDFWTNFRDLPRNEQEYKINLAYFMCAYCGGFPHATIQVKGITNE